MGKVTGFKEYSRQTGTYVAEQARIQNFSDIYIQLPKEELKNQAARCMDCGVPFCNYGCPLGNIIPDFNDLMYNNQWQKALEVLHSTNNFPEFTGKICPAPCEYACVLGINKPAVTIEQIELALVTKGWEEGWIAPQPAAVKTGKKIAIIGSGPAGLAAAQQLTRVGHDVTVYERNEAVGGCLRYGIPDYKLPKSYIDRRVEQMKKEGVKFIVKTNIGKDISISEIKQNFDVVCLTGGSTDPRDLRVPGRELKGIYYATDFLKQQNMEVAGIPVADDVKISAKGKKVVVIGGGDTGSDCIGTSLRQGAISIEQLELLPQPPVERAENEPWPSFPRLFKNSSSHDEAIAHFGKELRHFNVNTKSVEGENGVIKRLNCIKVQWDGRNMSEVAGSEFVLEADLVLLAMGFLSPEHKGMLDDLGVAYDERGNVKADSNYMTSIEGVFTAGDMRRGQSLVVHAISEGRKLAQCVDKHLMGKTFLRTVL